MKDKKRPMSVMQARQQTGGVTTAFRKREEKLMTEIDSLKQEVSRLRKLLLQIRDDLCDGIYDDLEHADLIESQIFPDNQQDSHVSD